MSNPAYENIMSLINPHTSKEYEEFVDNVCHEWFEYCKPKSLENNVAHSTFMTLYNLIRKNMLKNKEFALKVQADLKRDKENDANPT